MTASPARPADENAAHPAGESAAFDATDAAGELDAAGALDLFLPDAALGALRRLRPDASMLRYAARLARRPGTVARRAGKLAADLAGIATGSSAITPPRRDRRFSDPAWHENPLLKRTVQTYLAIGQTAEGLLADAELDWRDNERLKFVLTNLIAASAPSNYPLISPDAWKAFIDSGGLSPLRGIRALVSDMASPPRIPTMVAPDAFKVGTGSRGDAGGGRGPYRGLRAHPVPADHAHRAPVPAAHGPADDQQVLHHRYCAGPQHAGVLCRAGISGIRDLLAQPRQGCQALGSEHLRWCRRGLAQRDTRASPRPPRSTSAACAQVASSHRWSART